MATQVEIGSGSSGGVGICTVLFVVFLVLKLTGHIAWSWWWVTAPLWIPFGFVGVVIVVGLLFAFMIRIFGQSPWEK